MMSGYDCADFNTNYFALDMSMGASNCTVSRTQHRHPTPLVAQRLAPTSRRLLQVDQAASSISNPTTKVYSDSRCSYHRSTADRAV